MFYLLILQFLIFILNVYSILHLLHLLMDLFGFKLFCSHTKSYMCSWALFLSLCVPGLPVCDTHLCASSKGWKHHHCPASLSAQGQSRGTETSKTAKTRLSVGLSVCKYMFMFTYGDYSWEPTFLKQKSSKIYLKKKHYLDLK